MMKELRYFFKYLSLTMLLYAVLPLVLLETLCSLVTTPVVAFVKRKQFLLDAIDTIKREME